jgi:hypothetical protein
MCVRVSFSLSLLIQIYLVEPDPGGGKLRERGVLVLLLHQLQLLRRLLFVFVAS